MVCFIGYTDKIENRDLGYCLYLNLVEDKEYWLDIKSGRLFISENAGECLYQEIYLYTLIYLKKNNDISY